jgi:(2S)-methylsuccinyl-CoA dehydrogenase
LRRKAQIDSALQHNTSQNARTDAMTDAARVVPTDPILLPDLMDLTGKAVTAADALLAQARARLSQRVSTGGRVSNKALEAHGLAWIATYVEALRQMQAWAVRLEAEGRFGEMEG